MRLTSAGSSGVQSAEHVLERWFPTPHLLLPQAAGVDISDTSIKWMTLSDPRGAGREVAACGMVALPEGIVHGGSVIDAHALSQALKEIAPRLGAFAAHAALPEEAAYIFSMHVPEGGDHEQVLRLIEFEFEGRIPIPPSASVYDYSPIMSHDDGQGEEIGVSAFPRELSERYAAAFDEAGIQLLSLEVEARSIARAVSSHEPDEPITLLVDFGRARTGFAVLKRGIPIFTSTVEVGGDALMKAAMTALSLSAADAEVFRNVQGLVPQDGPSSAGAEAMMGTASALSDEIARHYQYWDTRRNESGERVTPVGKIVLVGGSSNLNGLPEYVAGRVQARVERGNIWRNICDFDQYIPPIDRATSLQFATAAGLALRSA